jgi:hypothetical protein
MSSLVLIDLETEKYTYLNLGLVDIQRNAIRSLSAAEFAVIGTALTEPQVYTTLTLTARRGKDFSSPPYS